MSSKLKQLLTVLLSVCVVFAFSSVSAFAEGEGTSVELDITNIFNMFKPTAAKLVTSGEDETLELAYSSKSYDKAYMGTSKDAVITADPTKTVEKKDGVYKLPIEKDAETVYVAFHSVKNEGWYNRIFTIDRNKKTLVTDNPGDPIVLDSYASEWDEEVGVTSTIGMFTVHKSKVTIEDDGTALVKILAGKDKREMSKIALIEQTKTDEEKEAIAITGTATKNGNNDYLYEFSIPVEKIGEQIPLSNYQEKDGVAKWHNWDKQHYLTVNNSVAVVNSLISKIQVQKNTETTDKYIELSRKLWDALGAEDKQKDDGYFSDATGDASKDDALNTAPDKEKELLVVSFGTSFNASRVATIGGVEKALNKAYGKDYAVRRAFTAQIIINHVQARDGEKIDNVTQAMDKAVKAGVKELVVQPTHLMSGAEYDELKAEIDKYAGKMKISYAKPLLDSDSDKQTVAKEVVAVTAKEAGFANVNEAVNNKDTAFVFMGHGTSHTANVTYTEMQKTMDKLGYKNCFIGTVEGNPASTALPEVKKAVEAKGYSKVVLRPLMVVAGDHANNDMAADEEGSWFYAFVNGGQFEVEGQDQPVDIGNGFGTSNVTCQIKGLGEITGIQNLYVAHTKAVIDKINKNNSVNKTAAAKAKVKKAKVTKVKVKAGKKKLTVTWKANTLFQGYQISYQKKGDKKAKTVNVKGAKSAKKVINKLAKKKKYTVKVRGYKTFNNTKVYGVWSGSKTVTVK